MLDLLISGARVFDGLGHETADQSVGVKDGRIAYMGPPLGANASHQRIDGKDQWLSPGFIDSHASTGLSYLMKGAADHKLYQGVSCELIGNCGTSPAPIGPRLVPTMEKLSEDIGFPFHWRDLASYFGKVGSVGLPLHLATLAGHSTLRGGALQDWHHLQPEEMAQMQTALAEAMQQGAFGLSSGLIYPPGCYAETPELAALAKTVAQYGGFYASHIRNERDTLEDAVFEAMEIGRLGGIPVLVSHLKAADKPNWGKIPKVLQQIEAYRAKHQMQIAVDVYPYTAVSTKLRAFLPKELLQDGLAAASQKLAQPHWAERAQAHLERNQTDLGAMLVISEDIPGCVGRSVNEIAASWQMAPRQAACELVRRNPETWIIYHCMAEADMDAAVLWPDAMVCSDSWSYPVNAPNQIGNPHPRTYGAFSRFLRRFVFERPLLSYAQAIRKITSMPAAFIGLEDRGRLAVGCWADLLLLDPQRFADRATYQKPRQHSEGVRFLWLNGKAAIAEGRICDDACGTIMRHRAA